MTNIDANISTYLGEKGYTIYKDAISITEQKFIREDIHSAIEQLNLTPS